PSGFAVGPAPFPTRRSSDLGLRPGQKMDQITLEEALYLFNLPRELGETPEGEKLVVNIGRFGPYVKYGSKYASLKEDDPYTITRDRKSTRLNSSHVKISYAV